MGPYTSAAWVQLFCEYLVLYFHNNQLTNNVTVPAGQHCYACVWIIVCQLAHPDKQYARTVAVNINYRCAAVMQLFLTLCESKASCGWERQWVLLDNARNTSLLHPYAWVHQIKTNIQLNSCEEVFTSGGLERGLGKGRNTLGLR